MKELWRSFADSDYMAVQSLNTKDEYSIRGICLPKAFRSGIMLVRISDRTQP